MEEVQEEVSSVRTDIQNTTTVLSLAIIDNTDNIGLVRRDVTANEAHINLAVRRIDENKAYIVENENGISGLETSVGKLLIKGAQCGFRDKWTSSSSTITYESLLLDTGRGSLDLSSGEWTAEEKGLYQVTWDLLNRLDS